MDLKNSWTVALKDFSIFKKQKHILLSLIFLPLILLLDHVVE
jgi:hypothetical protein